MERLVEDVGGAAGSCVECSVEDVGGGAAWRVGIVGLTAAAG